MRNLALAVLLSAVPASAAEFMGKAARPATSASDAALCTGLDQSRARLKSDFMRGSDFPGQVRAAFDGEGSADATAGNYLTRGQELYQLVATVEAQCRAAFGYGAGPTSEAEGAAVRRRAQSAKRASDLYLNLPRVIAAIDAREDPMELSLRPQFVTAMYKVADGPNYEAAEAIADAAQASRSRLRK